MYHIVTSDEMKKMEQQTMEGFGLSSLVLMERAALSVWDYMEEYDISVENTLILCGTGNNGGDGLAVGRILYENGYDPIIVMPGDRSKCTESTKHQLAILKHYQIPIYDTIPQFAYTTVIDALFGIGLNREIEGVYAEIIAQMNETEAIKIAVDIPSGIHADSGKVMGCAFCADITITFAYQKVGTLLYPGAEYAGKLIVKNIGIIENAYEDAKPKMIAYGTDDLIFPKRTADSHKGTYGKVLVIAGSTDMCGAALLSTEATFRTGAGMVKLFTDAANRVVIQERLPEVMTVTYDEHNMNEKGLGSAISWADIILMGPGMSQSETAKQIVGYVLKNSTCPIVLDADALNIIAEDDMEKYEWNREVIITPHLGEMSRLCRKDVSLLKEHIIDTAHDYADKHQLTCVLKDARTIVSAPEEPDYINLSGNAGMATAGAGDVLCGIIAGLLAQKVPAYRAATLGVYLHGMAGDVAAEQCGKQGMMATDIINGLTKILQQKAEI